MFCPSCGAPNNDKNQRYCRECGASLPVVDPAGRAGAPGAANAQVPAPRPTGGSGSAISRLPGNPLVTGAVVVVVAIVAIYLAIHVVLGIISSLIPIIVVLGALYLGFLYWRRSNRR